MPFSTVKTPVQPAELDILQRVFDSICAEHQLEKLGPDAEALALILVRQLQNGVKDESELAAVGSGLMYHARTFSAPAPDPRREHAANHVIVT